MTSTTIDGATETPIFDALLIEHEQSLPLIHLSHALRGPTRPGGRGANDRALGLEPRIVPSTEVPVLPRRRAH
ncbi:hypothetical protein [Cellulosimicrobium arenosum]|uniref:Uncharacterized protein n=1 Tax=Cellulosimicrobium arenosum TaxID=2708133 RepID=A0A927IZG4_9MICO|nr:hypothetical protein [Cellulosimicrobium arenosum]MBD8078548.1 hypothetical protein [Cellulosimicrobium arenosum]